MSSSGKEATRRAVGRAGLLRYRPIDFYFQIYSQWRARQDERNRCDCVGAVGGRGLGVGVGRGRVLACALPDEGRKEIERNQGQREPGSEPKQID